MSKMVGKEELKFISFYTFVCFLFSLLVIMRREWLLLRVYTCIAGGTFDWLFWSFLNNFLLDFWRTTWDFHSSSSGVVSTVLFKEKTKILPSSHKQKIFHFYYLHLPKNLSIFANHFKKKYLYRSLERPSFHQEMKCLLARECWWSTGIFIP